MSFSIEIFKNNHIGSAFYWMGITLQVTNVISVSHVSVTLRLYIVPDTDQIKN
jgi:hypothetical protein